MFHAAYRRADVAHPVEWIGAEALFEEVADAFDIHEGSGHVAYLRRLGVHVDGNRSVQALVIVFPEFIFADGCGDVLCGDFLFSLPVPCRGAVVVVGDAVLRPHPFSYGRSVRVCGAERRAAEERQKYREKT